MQRITEKMLELRMMRLNAITNSPTEAYTVDEYGQYKANPGHFHLSHAYGGVCVHRMHNDAGGVTTPILSYHTTKRDMYDRLNAFIDGIEFSKRSNQTN
jgi:hypothetical protein